MIVMLTIIILTITSVPIVVQITIASLGRVRADPTRGFQEGGLLLSLLVVVVVVAVVVAYILLLFVLLLVVVVVHCLVVS